MRNPRPLYLILLCLCLIGTWTLYGYDKAQQGQSSTNAAGRLPVNSRLPAPDSLRLLLETARKELHATRLHRDSLLRMQAQQREYLDSLRDEYDRLTEIYEMTHEQLDRALRKNKALQGAGAGRQRPLIVNGTATFSQ
ncbi:MAG TPA: hypothetical protein PKE63_13680 [Lacibacter sp.]|mgnify:CR=1 FL=1|nr:hypothetical protein [Lacibacter sp.]HMO88971.1 hypothetical protein [Lacibacter sp.]HMP88324.1 hypothetical protein [Lacibacter sp.]